MCLAKTMGGFQQYLSTYGTTLRYLQGNSSSRQSPECWRGLTMQSSCFVGLGRRTTWRSVSKMEEKVGGGEEIGEALEVGIWEGKGEGWLCRR